MTIIKTTVACLLATCAFTAVSNAGGFSRGEADTDILYEDGTFVVRGGATYVAPQRGYDSIGIANGTDGDFTENFTIPSVAAKFRFSDNFSCALSYTQPFGADSEYGNQAQAADRAADLVSVDWAFPTGNAVKSAGFDSDEYAGTCAVNFAVGRGEAYVIGGIFSQSFDYTESKDFGTLNLKDDSALGYRIGAAYEIKEYALRAQLLYRSEVEQKTEGVFTPSPTLLAYVPTLPATTTASGTGKLPQSMEFSLQSGIAPDWLAFGSVKWTDWSVLQTLDYNIVGLGDLKKNFYWRDGWTITGGLGHKFNETVSGAASLTWDRGVGTGADIQTDTWTVSAGADIKAGPGTLRLGGAISYLTAGSQSVAKEADFDATANGDWAYALSASYKISF
ncbi:OmpP1/FadL family transporter [Agrobacterium sp. ES01]|uniref:OmpP1/FadL family transporter n=1 Tax=Agrobacterium sp. ES01 TaxID=3420714 RepID=UPI003D112097